MILILYKSSHMYPRGEVFSWAWFNIALDIVKVTALISIKRIYFSTNFPWIIRRLAGLPAAVIGSHNDTRRPCLAPFSRSTFFTESNVIMSVTTGLHHLMCEKASQFVPLDRCFYGYQVGSHIPTRLTSLIPCTVNVIESIAAFHWATWSFRSWNIEPFIYKL